MTLRVGLRELQVSDASNGISFPVFFLYPTEAPSSPTPFGSFTIDASPNAPVAKGRFPLVVISHGNGGSPLLYRTIGAHLAEHGYLVAMLEHHGNNRRDNTQADSHENLVNRPRHVSLTIDAVSSDPELGDHLIPDQVAVVGHSFGGYTALAVAGGLPSTRAGQAIRVEADPRVRALVLLAPATPWYFHPDSLRAVTVPILMLIAEHDPFSPRWHADLVLDGVPDRSRVTWRTVENAGHFSFLSPFPDQMRTPGFRPATDPPGFDRERFHRRLPGEIQDFLDRTLGGTRRAPVATS